MGIVEGKVVLITGAGRGIGRAEALAFAREGASVVVNDTGVARDGSGEIDPSVADGVVKEIEAAGGKAVASSDPVHDEKGATRVVDAAMDAFGRVDVVVNNAGIVRDKPILKMSADDFRAIVDVSLFGTFLVSQAALRRMLAQKDQLLKTDDAGRIINTVSISGLLGNQGQANYAAANGGVYGLTRTLAIEMQKHRIFVNALAPIAKTRMTEDLPMFQGLDSLTPEHVAAAALFLGSSLAKERTGTVLAVSGAQLYSFKLVQAAGRFKDADGIWTPEEISANWEAITKVGHTT